MNSSSSILYSNLFLLDAESLIKYGGLFLVIVVTYASTGLFFLFFLPSGGVLFSAGLFTASGSLHNNIYAVCGFLTAAAVLGNCTGYWMGYKAGPSFYRRKDSRFFRKQYLITAEKFYKKYGWLALTMGLYIPIIRTFAPVVAGMVNMNFRSFFLLSLLGAVIWICSFTLAGYYIGSSPLLKSYLKYIIGGFILIITVPLLVRTIREMRKSNTAKKEAGKQ